MKISKIRYLDELEIVFVGAFRRRVVDAAGRELVLGVIDNAWVVEVGKNGEQTSRSQSSVTRPP